MLSRSLLIREAIRLVEALQGDLNRQESNDLAAIFHSRTHRELDNAVDSMSIRAGETE